MRRLGFLGMLLLLPVGLALLASAGCGEKKDTEVKTPSSTDGGARPISSRGGATGGKKEELASSGFGVLKGKVVLEGGTPEIKADIVFPDQKDKDYCHKGDASEQTWKIDAGSKGIANVVVWLRAPKNSYFKLADGDKKRDEPVKIDQPFCAFTPHVSILYPSYFDAKEQKQVETGEKLKIVNSAEIPHNTNWTSSDGSLIKGDNVQMIAKTAQRVIDAKVSKDKDAGKEQRIDIHCDIHKWMTGYVWVFDHPYTAVTKADGTFEIKNAPTGAEVDIMYWHESFDKGAKKLETTALKDGDTKEIKISAK